MVILGSGYTRFTEKKKENDMRVNAKLLFFSALSLLNSCLFIQIADQTIYVLFWAWLTY